MCFIVTTLQPIPETFNLSQVFYFPPFPKLKETLEKVKETLEKVKSRCDRIIRDKRHDVAYILFFLSDILNG